MTSFNPFSLPIIFLSMLSFLSLTAHAADPVNLNTVCENSTYSANNSIYQSNLKSLLSSFSSNANIEFFFTNSGPDTSDPVYGLFDCRGDVTRQVCRDCVEAGVKELTSKCSREKVAITWYDECVLRYSNRSFFSTVDERPMFGLLNTQNVTDQDKFNQLLNASMIELLIELAKETSEVPIGIKKFGTKEVKLSAFQTLYSLVQCTPDLSSTGCNGCLRDAIKFLPWCCSGKQGGRVVFPSCNIRYELYPFYTREAIAPMPPGPQPPSPRLQPPPPVSVRGAKVKERPDLESKFDERVQAAVKYARMIEDFNELIDPRTLASHCLGPEPSLYLLSALDREEKKQMTSKFNKEMYKKIKEKKNDPLSSIGQKKLMFTDKEIEKEKEKEMVERGSSTPILELDGQEASLGVSVEEVARPLKRMKVGGKGKEKVGSSVWFDAEAAVDRVNEFFTLGEMKEISSTPSHEMVNRHVHKLVQVLGETMHITTQYLANEEKAVIANSKVEALEAEASGLRNDLGVAMDALNASKEKTKILTEQLESEKLVVKQKDDLLASAGQRMKVAVAKAVTAFQTTEEYNIILFQWYFKGFELLRRYMIKHGSGVDLENLDFEAVDREMEEDEAAQASAQTAASIGVEPPPADRDDGDAAQA